STTSEQGPRPFPKPFTRPYAHPQRPTPGVHRSRCAGVSHPSASLATMAPTPRVPRERTEEIERTTLSERATLSSETKGREREEALDPLRAAFQRDRDRIVHAKAFRRLKHKTQVFLSPEGDHYRVRLTHTLEVSQIARTVARALRLNEDLAEAIALGHDLGLLRDFMFESVYLRAEAHKEQDKAIALVRALFTHYLEHPDQVPPEYHRAPGDTPTRVADYIAGMTDRYALRTYEEIFLPQGW